MNKNYFRRRGINSELIGVMDSIDELKKVLRSNDWKENRYGTASQFSLRGCDALITVFDDGYVAMVEYDENGRTRADGYARINDCVWMAGTLIVGASVEV